MPTYTCRCGAHHSQPQLMVRLDGVADCLEVQLCSTCTIEMRSFMRNLPAFPVQHITAWPDSDIELDDLDAELDEDLAYDLAKENAA